MGGTIWNRVFPLIILDDSAKMSYYKIVPKSDYTKMKDCHSAAYQNITKALEQDEDKQSKLLQGELQRV